MCSAKFSVSAFALAALAFVVSVVAWIACKPDATTDAPKLTSTVLTAEQIEALAALASARQKCVEGLTVVLAREHPKASITEIETQVNRVCLDTTHR
jgi:hypothetical protein